MRQTFVSESGKKFQGSQDQAQLSINPKQLSRLGLFAIAGQVILAASAWLLPAVSEYRLIGDNISELVLGRFGFLQVAAFLVAGVSTLGLAYAIRKLTAGATGSLIGSLLVGVYGAGAILVGVFPTDRIDAPEQVFSQSPMGMVHMLIATVSFLSMIVAMFVLARTFGKTAHLRPLLIGSVLFAGSALASFIVQGEGPLVGLLQRALVAVISGWIVMVSLRIRSLAASGSFGLSRGNA